MKSLFSVSKNFFPALSIPFYSFFSNSITDGLMLVGRPRRMPKKVKRFNNSFIDRQIMVLVLIVMSKEDKRSQGMCNSVTLKCLEETINRSFMLQSLDQYHTSLAQFHLLTAIASNVSRPTTLAANGFILAVMSNMSRLTTVTTNRFILAFTC